jgi:c-di-GMP-related signal transduction protein
MDVFVARQAIFDRQRRVYAYELLFRSSAENNSFDGTEASSATRQVLANTLFAIGLDNILCGKKAFVNLGHQLLLDGLHSILPNDVVVFELLETIEPGPEVFEACRKLRDAGYKLALDDFNADPRFQPLTAFADLIKIDVRTTTKEDQERLVRTYKSQGIQMLAEKVESYEEFRWMRGVGYDYFQGYFFTRPVVVQGRQIPASVSACLRLLEAAQRPEMDFDGVAVLISEDVALSYKLLRYANSALFSRSRPIESIQDALIRIGEYHVRRWTLLATLHQLAAKKPSELATLSVVRAHFCECVAQLAEIRDHAAAFLMGLFSLLDALIDSPLHLALAEVKLAPEIVAVLLGTSGETDRLTLLYKLMLAYEAANWDEVEALSGRLAVSAVEVADSYLDATRWAGELVTSMAA